MSELSGISGQDSVHKLTSKPRATLESIQEKKEIETSFEVKELEKFKVEMNRAFSLMHEIRSTLETALKNLH